MFFKHNFILKQEFPSPYSFTVNQNSDNESLDIQIYPLHFSFNLHYAFTTPSVRFLGYYGGITVVLR